MSEVQNEIQKALSRASKQDKALPSGAIFRGKPIDGWIWLKPTKLEELQSKGGIIIPESVSEKASVYEVLAVGPGELCTGTGGIYPPPVAAGAYVLVDVNQLMNLTYSGQETIVCGRAALIMEVEFVQDGVKS
jgi:co-chaperonin GroES (HSP10)